MALLTDELVQGETDSFEDQIKDYVRLVGACKDLVENRNFALLEFQTRQGEATLASEKLQKAQGTAKASAFSAEALDANEATTEAEQKFKTLTKNVKIELGLFKLNKSHNLRKALRELVTLNINYNLRVVNLWKELLIELEEAKF